MSSRTTEPANRRLHVSFILSSLRLSGGVQAIIEYANRLAARGHSATLVIPRGAIDASMAVLLAPGVALVEASRPLTDTLNPLKQLLLAVALARAVPVCDVVVATHTPTTLSSLIASHLLRRAAAVWLFMDYVAMFAGRPAERWLLRNALRWHRMAITISKATAAELANYAPGRVEVAGLGISTIEQLTPVIAEERPASPPSLFYLGDQRPRKGLADFLQAAALVQAQMPALQLWIASKEPCTIETAVPYTFHLHPTRNALVHLFQTCTIFVSASHAEGLGNPPLEAMACGAPVVMTASGGSADYARDGENCLLTPPQDPERLAEAILRLLREPMLAQKLSHAGPATAARFDWTAVMDRLEGFLREAAR